MELALPAVSKILGSEGIFGVKEVESDHVSIVPTSSSSIHRPTSLVTHKDATSAVNAPESASWGNNPRTECLRHASQLQGEDVSVQLKCRGSNSSVLFISRSDSVQLQLQRKTGKVSRSGSGCSKRPRTAQMEDLSSQNGRNDINGTSDTLGFYPTKYMIPEKGQVVKQKNNLNGKRGDKRNGKAPSKTKNELFSLKAGLASFTSTAGGNNILGLYGLKSDIYDATKLVDELSLNELSLNELLDGSYKRPSLGKAKAKGVENVNENFLLSIKKACSILPLQGPLKSQNFSETDSSSNQKMSPCPLNSTSCVASSACSPHEDTNATDLSVHYEDSSMNPGTLAATLDFSLLQPKDVLERLALPPPKDLEVLLLDAAKPATFSRNHFDPRSGKPTSNRACLPPFPWSHTLGGNCKTNSDAAKLSSSRTTCQGRWARIEHEACFLGIISDSFTDLKSFTYDCSLVPYGELKSENGTATSITVNLPCFKVGVSSSGTCTEPSLVPPEVGGSMKYELNAGRSPRVLAAAQTLVDIKTHYLMQNPSGMIRWPNRPSQKAMKARKLKLNEKPEEFFATPKSVMEYDNLVKSTEHIRPTKKPKLSVSEKKKDVTHVHAILKGPISWSAPKSCRSSPNRSVRDSVADAKHYNANSVKQSCMLPPAARALEKAYSSQQKPRKVVAMDWNRARDKLE